MTSPTLTKSSVILECERARRLEHFYAQHRDALNGDAQCVQLECTFMRTFNEYTERHRIHSYDQVTAKKGEEEVEEEMIARQRNIEDIMNQFESIYALVRSIVLEKDRYQFVKEENVQNGEPNNADLVGERTTMVHCIWMRCCAVVTTRWSDRLASMASKASSIELLDYVLDCWQRYRAAVNVIYSFTIYLMQANIRSLAARQTSFIAPPGNTKLDAAANGINDVCYSIFVNNLLSDQNEQLIFDATTTLIDQVERLRDKTRTKKRSVRTIRAILGLLQSVDVRNHRVYYVIFGFPYLALLQARCSTIKFADPRTWSGIEEKSTTTSTSTQAINHYLRRVEKIIECSIRCSNRYRFSAPLRRMIARLLYTQLVGSQRVSICTEATFDRSIFTCGDDDDDKDDEDRLSQLAYSYHMLAFDRESIDLLAVIVERHVREQLQNIPKPWLSVESLKCSAKEAKQFMSQCVALYGRWFHQIGKLSFCGDRKLLDAMQRAFVRFANSDPTIACVCAIAQHVDLWSSSSWNGKIKCLKSNTKNDVTDADVDICRSLFAMFDDRRAIGEYARYFLCERLLLRPNVDKHVDKHPPDDDDDRRDEYDVAEITRFIDSLQIETPFGVKLLLKDYRSSALLSRKRLIEDTKLQSKLPQPLSTSSAQKQQQAQFEIRLLNASFWNLIADDYQADDNADNQSQLWIKSKFRLPKSFWLKYNMFQRQFKANNTKKTIRLNRTYGTVTMVGNFAHNRRYQFELTFRQAVILIVFNRRATLSFDEIAAITQIDADSLRECIFMFVHYRLLSIIGGANGNKNLAKHSNENDEHQYDYRFLEQCTFEINHYFGDNFNRDVVKPTLSQCNEPIIDWIERQYGANLDDERHYSHRYSIRRIMWRCGNGNQSCAQSKPDQVNPKENEEPAQQPPEEEEVNLEKAKDTGRIKSTIKVVDKNNNTIDSKQANVSTLVVGVDQANGTSSANSTTGCIYSNAIDATTPCTHSYGGVAPSSHPRARSSNERKAESNVRSCVVRLEAAVVRVMKRATIVQDLTSLRELTIDALASTAWTTLVPHSEGVKTKLKTKIETIEKIVSLADLRQTIESLEKNGYVRSLPNGQIVYEP